MIRSTTAANTRAIDKILLGRKPVEACGCDQSEMLVARLAKLHELADRLEREDREMRAELEARRAMGEKA